jgi:hypothetical protein
LDGDEPVAKPLPTHRTKTQNKGAQYRHPYLEWDSNPRPQSSCLRQRGYCDRLTESVMASKTGRPSTVRRMRVTFNECRFQVLDRVFDATGNIGVALVADREVGAC